MIDDAALKHVLLDLLSTARPVAKSRIDLLSDANWQAMAGIAKQHRIGPMLHHTIKAQNLGGSVPADIRMQWAAAYRKSAFRYLSFCKTLVRLNTVLEKANIPFAALKGAWLSRYAYDDPVLRPMRDIDIIVEPSAALSVYALLEKNGFARIEEYPMPLEGALDYAKHLPAMRCDETGAQIELHTRLMSVPVKTTAKGNFEDVSALLSRRKYRDEVPYLSPTDTLLHLIIHAAYDHQFNNGPLTFTDIALLLERSTIDWSLFWTMAKAGNWVRGCLIIFELAAHYHHTDAWRETYMGTVPAPSAVQLESAALLSLQDFDHRGVIGFKAEIADNAAWLGKARLLISHIFPPLHSLAAFAGTPTASYWSLLHYPRWAAAKMIRVFFKKDGDGVSQDINRARVVRTWLYDDGPIVFSADLPV